MGFRVEIGLFRVKIGLYRVIYGVRVRNDILFEFRVEGLGFRGLPLYQSYRSCMCSQWVQGAILQGLRCKALLLQLRW